MIHSDVLKTAQFVPEFRGKRQLLEDHCTALTEAVAGRPIWMPTFNYDFTSKHCFDVKKSRSQVGALTQHFLKHVAKWRTEVPIFSYAGTGPMPDVAEGVPVKPFGVDSIFARLAEANGSILFYGAPIKAVTFLHYVEELCEIVYRYDKSFSGTVIGKDGSREERTVEFHVRPMGLDLEYDCEKMQSDLHADGVAAYVGEKDSSVIAVSARELIDYWKIKLRDDPFYFIKARCREPLEARYRELGRRFRQADFEPEVTRAGAA